MPFFPGRNVSDSDFFRTENVLLVGFMLGETYLNFRNRRSPQLIDCRWGVRLKMSGSNLSRFAELPHEVDHPADNWPIR